MIVNSPDNAALKPCPGISLEVLSNSSSKLRAVSFATQRCIGAVSGWDGVTFEAGARLCVMKDAVSAEVRSARSV